MVICASKSFIKPLDEKPLEEEVLPDNSDELKESELSSIKMESSKEPIEEPKEEVIDITLPNGKSAKAKGDFKFLK